jgi:hypothetical protein
MTVQLNQSQFSAGDMLAFEPAMKIGLLATVNPQGLPHLTLISSLKAGTPQTVIFGQFIEGLSKQYVRGNNKTAFMIMTLDKRVWRGKARWTHTETGGPDFEWFNNVPMFRYNAYFGIHTVHYMDLIGQTGCAPLPMNAVVLAAIKTIAARTLSARPKSKEVMNAWTRGIFDKLDNLKFLAYLDSDGYPWIIPVIQAQSDGTERLLISTSVYGDELAAIPTGSPVAMLGMALTMEDVLVRGIFTGLQRRGGLSCAGVQVDWVYNAMPPVPGQIYPPLAQETVTVFD